MLRYEEDIQQMLSRGTSHNDIFGDFCRNSIKTRKNWPSSFKFQYMSIHAIRSNIRQKTVSMPKDSGYICNSIDAKTRFSSLSTR